MNESKNEVCQPVNRRPKGCYTHDERLRIERLLVQWANASGRKLCWSTLAELADAACDRLTERVREYGAAQFAWRDCVRANSHGPNRRREKLLGEHDVQAVDNPATDAPLPSCYVRLVKDAKRRMVVIGLSEGMPVSDIADELGVTRGTIYAWLRTIERELAIMNPHRKEPLTLILQQLVRTGRIR